MFVFVETKTDPTGAPNPFEKQRDTLSKGSHKSFKLIPVSTATFHNLAPKIKQEKNTKNFFFIHFFLTV